MNEVLPVTLTEYISSQQAANQQAQADLHMIAAQQNTITDWQRLPDGSYTRQVGSKTVFLTAQEKKNRDILFKAFSSKPEPEVKPLPPKIKTPLSVDTVAFLTWIMIIGMVLLGTYLL